MYLVTNDPVQYLSWALTFLAVLVVIVVLGTLGKATYRWIWWITTKPPASVQSGDCVKLRNGVWGKVGAGYDDGTYLVDVPAFGEMQVVERINIKDMRPI